MCLSVPAKVVSVRGDRAIVETRNGQREIDVSLVSVAAGDYVLAQAGVAVERLEPEEAAEILAAWAEVEGAPDA